MGAASAWHAVTIKSLDDDDDDEAIATSGISNTVLLSLPSLVNWIGMGFCYRFTAAFCVLYDPSVGRTAWVALLSIRVVRFSCQY